MTVNGFPRITVLHLDFKEPLNINSSSNRTPLPMLHIIMTTPGMIKEINVDEIVNEGL